MDKPPTSHVLFLTRKPVKGVFGHTGEAATVRLDVRQEWCNDPRLDPATFAKVSVEIWTPQTYLQMHGDTPEELERLACAFQVAAQELRAAQTARVAS